MDHRGARRQLTRVAPGVAQVYLLTNDWFGLDFQRTALAECRLRGAILTLVMADPVRGMTPSKRWRTRRTRPIRERIETVRRGTVVRLVEDVNDRRFCGSVPHGAHGAVTGFNQILRKPTIDRFASLVNVHPSLLPYYRGPAPVYWCQVHGENQSGFTIHEVTEKVDDGPVLRQGVVTIAGSVDPLQTIVDVALPHFGEWIGSVLDGAPFPHVTVDATAVYRVLDGYRPRLSADERADALRRSGRTGRRVD